ncbi:MAG: DUF6622 family protein [Lysobacter sp.]
MPLSALLTHTPVWVYALLALLIWLGAQRLRPRTTAIARVWTVPAIFIAWGLWGLFARDGASADIAAHWFAGALLGVGLGAWSLAPAGLSFDHRNGLVRQAGSVMPMLRILAIFLGHYVLQVIASVSPHLRDSAMGADIYVSGISAGFFIGWTIRFVWTQRRAPQTDLLAAVA